MISPRRRASGRVAILLLLAAVSAGCASRPARVPATPAGWSERGLASWYGPKFHGKTTASGEVFDMHALTAAHRRLPFGTVVEVRHRRTGRRVRVRINDRGPFKRGRIIDLSYAAARELGILEEGLAPVRIAVMPGPAHAGERRE